jgi:hypothetical protein
VLNFHILKAWPNWLTIPVMGAFWVVIIVLVARLLGAAPAQQGETTK